MDNNRREFITAAGTALTASIFTGNLKGANDRIALGFIGAGIMGQVNLTLAMREPGVQVGAICDVYPPNLETAVTMAQKGGHKPKSFKDFRDLLADKSIDAVCISTPDHWHAWMMVEACKAGKDVYVEKPACLYVDEAPKMVQAARKYNRVVQCGTQSRSSGHMPAIREVLASGRLGQVTFVRVWDYSLEPQEGIGNPPDCAPPPGLDWNMWVGPAPMRPFNQNRFQVQRGTWSAYRYYWDYAGGRITDNGVHLIDLVQMAFNETAPTAVVALGNKTYLKDSRETPDTQNCLFEYPEFIMAYEHRYANGQSMIGKGSGILVHGTKGTLCFGRPPAYQIYAEREPVLAPVNAVGILPPLTEDRVATLGYLGGARVVAPEGGATAGFQRLGPAEAPKPSVSRSLESTQSHWANFLECVRTRRKPVGDIECAARSSVTGLLGTVAMRGKIRVDYDPKTWTSPQKEARAWMAYKYRAPWKLEEG
jgi:predicted dehydrogenase